MVFCFDLDGTITAFPEAMGALMDSLSANGHDVQVLSGHRADAPTQEVAEEKARLLRSLGCNSWSMLTVVANPKDDVAAQKVAYMKHAGAHVLVDNDKRNVKAAKKAGFLALRPK